MAHHFHSLIDSCGTARSSSSQRTCRTPTASDSRHTSMVRCHHIASSHRTTSVRAHSSPPWRSSLPAPRKAKRHIKVTASTRVCAESIGVVTSCCSCKQSQVVVSHPASLRHGPAPNRRPRSTAGQSPAPPPGSCARSRSTGTPTAPRRRPAARSPPACSRPPAGARGTTGTVTTRWQRPRERTGQINEHNERLPSGRRPGGPG